MSTVEGDLVAKWRKARQLTQQELGDACPEQKERAHVKQVEGGRSSASVKTLLNLIHGLAVPGRDDAAKLARFFQGPERQDVEDALGRALEDMQAALAPPVRRRSR